MSKLIARIVDEIFPRIFGWFQDRYFPKYVREGLEGDRRSLTQRLWAHNKSHLFGVDGLVLLTLLTCWLYSLQLRAIHRLVFSGDPSFELHFPSVFLAWFQYALQGPVFVILVVFFAVLIATVWQQTLLRATAIRFAAILVMLTVGNVSYGLVEGWMITQRGSLRTFEVAQAVYSQAALAEEGSEIELAQKYYAIAERLFRRMIRRRMLPSRDAKIWAYLSHIRVVAQ
jgi:hypothetical protein